MIPLRIFWRATPPAVKWAALGALVLALAFIAGRYTGGQAAALDDARDKLETHERMDDADVSTGDVGDDRDWLRKRGD